jgi:para-aminobenzoate synthetase / 4-amino-4-deoxychorismate lyase
VRVIEVSWRQLASPGSNGRSYSIGSRPLACNPERQDHPIQPSRPDPARGVFETLLVLGGVPVELERHLERLAASVAELYGAELPRDAGDRLRGGAAGLATGRIRLTLFPDGDRLAADVVAVAVDRESILPTWERALMLEPAGVAGGLGAHKWADRDLLGRLEPEPAVRVALLHDADGGVLETSRGNVFAVRDGEVVTPPLDGRILPGVTRAVAIEELRASGLEVAERTLRLADLTAADELLTTGSVRGVEPVRTLVGEPREWSPGPVSELLAARLRGRWRVGPGVAGAAGRSL